MASFTEQATLRVIDQSSSQLRKINAELKKLFATANSLKNIKVNIDVGGISKASAEVRRLANDLNRLKSTKAAVDVTGIAKAHAEVRRLTAELQRLNAARININTNLSGINQAHNRLRALHTAAARPVSIRTLLTYGATGQAVRAVGHATVQGTKQVDIGRTGLDVLQLKGRRGDVEKELDRVMSVIGDKTKYPGPQQFNRGLVASRYAEALLQVREGEPFGPGYRPLVDPQKPWGPTREATEAEKYAESRKRMSMATERVIQELNVADLIAKKTGKSPEESITKVAGYFKALEQAGWMTTPTGEFDPGGLAKGGDFIRRAINMVGEEATGRFMATLFRREKGARFTLSERGQLMASAVAEEMDPATAGTAISSWMQQTQGRGTKESMKARVAAGMMENVYGTDKKGRQVVTGYKPKAAELAMTDPLQYAKEVLIPGLQKMGLTLDEIYSNEGTKIAKVKAALDKLHSNSNAAQFAQVLITKGDELNRQIIDAYSRDSSMEATRQSTQRSVIGATNAISGQFKGMMGEIVVAAQPAIGAVSESLSSFFKENADTIRQAGEGDVAAQAKVLALGGGAAVGGMAALGGLRWLMGKTGIAGNLGWASGMMAMIGGTDAERAAGGAGIALIEAAGELKAAAAYLQGKSILDSPFSVGPDGKPTSTKGAPKPGTPGGAKPGMFSRMGTAIANTTEYIVGAAAASAVTLGKYIKNNPKTIARGIGRGTMLGGLGMMVYDLVGSSPDKAKTDRDRLANAEKLKQTMRDLRNEEAAAARMIGGLRGEPNERTKRLIQQSLDRIKLLKEEMRQQQILYEGTQFGAPPTSVKTSPVRNFPTTPIPGSSPILNPTTFSKAVTDGLQAKPVPTTPVSGFTGQPLPGSQPIVPSGLTPTPNATTVGSLIPQLAQSSNSITTAASSLATTTTTFGTTFETGATAIGGAGKVAADHLSGAAEGIGNTIGSAAAAQISAAAAKVSIQVNHTGATPNTGKSAPDP